MIMNMVWSKKSDAILKIGFYLESVGVHNWALTKKQALMALDKFEIEGIAILGGDVYEKRKNGLQSNYDNWYCDREASEMSSDFVSRSIAKTRDYISNYEPKQEVEYFFAIVPEC